MSTAKIINQNGNRCRLIDMQSEEYALIQPHMEHEYIIVKRIGDHVFSLHTGHHWVLPTGGHIPVTILRQGTIIEVTV